MKTPITDAFVRFERICEIAKVKYDAARTEYDTITETAWVEYRKAIGYHPVNPTKPNWRST